MSSRVTGPPAVTPATTVPMAKAQWKADAELKDLEDLILERTNLLLEETRGIRRVWLGLTVAAFAIAVSLIFLGYERENANLTWVGSVLNLLLGPPVTTQLWRIRSNIIKIAGLPVSVKLRLKKCWLKSKTKEEYEECLVGVMDEIDEIFRKLSSFWPAKVETTTPGTQV